MPRIFLTPTVLIRALSSGAPSLHDVIAEAMTVTGEDPEIEIVRATSRVAPPSWVVEVRAGKYVRRLPLDLDNVEAMRAAVALFLFELVQDLRGELPAIVDRPDFVEAVLGLLRQGEGASRATERPS